jgi:hypothetical protein
MSTSQADQSGDNPLDRGLAIVFQRHPLLYLINLLTTLPGLLLTIWLLGSGRGGVSWHNLPTRVLVVSVLSLLVLRPIGNAACLHVISQGLIGQRVRLQAALSFAVTEYIPLVVTSFMAWACIGMAFIAGLLPYYAAARIWPRGMGLFGLTILLAPILALVVCVWLTFVPQVVIVEDQLGSSAIYRSRDLVRNEFWGIVMGIVALAIVFFALHWVTGYVEVLFPYRETHTLHISGRALQVSRVTNPSNRGINLVARELVTALTLTLSAVWWTLFYFDIRLRSGNFDLQAAALRQTKKELTVQAGEPELAE